MAFTRLATAHANQILQYTYSPNEDVISLQEIEEIAHTEDTDLIPLDMLVQEVSRMDEMDQ